MGLSSIIGKLVGSTAAQPIEAIGNVLDKLFTSDEEKAAARAVMAKLAMHPSELQVELNKVEAGHRSVFVAGWRPWIGWVAGISLGLFYIPQYTVAAWLWAHQALSAGTLPPYPVTADGLMELVVAMLGMGVLRSAEKLVGKAK